MILVYFCVCFISTVWVSLSQAKTILPMVLREQWKLLTLFFLCWLLYKKRLLRHWTLPSVDPTRKCVDTCHNISGCLVGSWISRKTLSVALVRVENKNGTESKCYAPILFTFRRTKRSKPRRGLNVLSTGTHLCWCPPHGPCYSRTLAEVRNGIAFDVFLSWTALGLYSYRI